MCLDLPVLYHLRPETFVEPGLLTGFRTQLTVDECQRVDRFHFQRDREDRLIARAMVRTVLSHRTGVDPRDWRFRANEFGRPEIETPAEFRELKFSLSHGRGLIVCLTALSRDIGVDVEPLRPVDDLLGIARRFFAPAEAQSLVALPAEKRLVKFLEFWTLKESYVKARGMGLSLPLAKFAFQIAGDGANEIAIEIAPSLNDDAGRWQFSVEWFGTEHIVATAMDRRGADRIGMERCDASVLMSGSR